MARSPPIYDGHSPVGDDWAAGIIERTTKSTGIDVRKGLDPLCFWAVVECRDLGTRGRTRGRATGAQGRAVMVPGSVRTKGNERGTARE